MALKILQVAHNEHPYYGVRRLALHLSWSQNKTRRIRIQAGIVVATASKKRHKGYSASAEIIAPANALKSYANFRNNNRSQDGMNYSGMTKSGGWVQDFTYLWFDRSMHYLAVVLDLKTRRVVGWQLGTRHTSELTHSAVLDALSKYPAPTILHSDQGSEYLSYRHQLLCQKRRYSLVVVLKAAPGKMASWNAFSAVSSLNLAT